MKITLILVSAISFTFLGTLQVPIHVGQSVIINNINSGGRNYLEIVKALVAYADSADGNARLRESSKLKEFSVAFTAHGKTF